VLDVSNQVPTHFLHNHVVGVFFFIFNVTLLAG